MNCETCAYFESEKGEDGDCTRYPPTTVVITSVNQVTRQVSQVPTSFFPRVRKDQSCGEWTSKVIQ